VDVEMELNEEDGVWKCGGREGKKMRAILTFCLAY